MTIGEKFDAYANEVLQKLQAADLRASVDLRNEKIGAKIREGRLNLVPYLAVVGERESNAGTCGVRSRKEGELGEIAVDALIERLTKEVKMRAL